VSSRHCQHWTGQMGFIGMSANEGFMEGGWRQRKQALTSIDNIIHQTRFDIRLHNSSPGKISKNIGNG